METIGLLGYGVMGAAAGKKIMESGYGLVVCDPSPDAARRAEAAGAAVALDPARVGAQCRLAVMFLPGPPEVEAAVAGQKGLLAGMPAGSLIVDHSTVDPGTSLRMQALGGEKKVAYLDAPVLGRPAAVGQWTLPVGGDAADLARCRSVLESYAARLIPVGPCGSGNKIKLLNQMMFAAINAMTAEMMAVADRMGIDARLLVETITASRAATVSNLFAELGKHIIGQTYGDPTFSVDLLCKDTRLAVQTARDHHAAPLLMQTIQFINETAQLQGLGRLDTAVMWKAYRNMWRQSPGRQP